MIKKDSIVRIHYKLIVDDQVIESSQEEEPLEFVQGSGKIFPGIEEALEGLSAGDRKEILLPPEKCFGEPNPDAYQKVPKSAFGDQEELKVGDQVSGNAGGTQFEATISEVGKDDIILDLNHPLAGKTLKFVVEVIEVHEAA